MIWEPLAWGECRSGWMVSGTWTRSLVDHGDERDVMPCGQVAENLFEGFDVVGAVVWREGDAGEQDLDVGLSSVVSNLVEVAAGLGGRKTAKAVVAARILR